MLTCSLELVVRKNKHLLYLNPSRQVLARYDVTTMTHHEIPLPSEANKYNVTWAILPDETIFGCG
jgi:hypothetical protein